MDLPVSDGAVAGAVCALALEHVADLACAYAELARVVVRGGWVVVSTTHPTIRMILGWGACFIDGEGRGEIPTFPQTVADHLNAAAGAGPRLVTCAEPAIAEDAATRRAPSSAPVAGKAALQGVPVVLVCQFEKS